MAERGATDGDWEHHLREFLDAFYARDGRSDLQSAMIAGEPRSLADARADAFLGVSASTSRDAGV